MDERNNMEELVTQVEQDAKLIDEIVSKLVLDYCQPLDDFMKMVKEVLDDTTSPPTDVELEAMALRLPNLLYFTGEAVESLGIRGDIADQIRLDLYNSVLIKATGTVADKQALASKETQNEELVKMCYTRAYKKIKLRMEAGYEMLNSVKKVLSRRQLELQLTYESHGGKVYE